MKPMNAIKIHEKMKYLFYFFFYFISLNSSAQNISGLYSGTLVNDSLKMVQNYELALSEYKGKITGYSYITFVSNDTFYYGIKRIKATRKNGELVVEDVAMLANNYPKRPDKGVHVINRIPLPEGDSILELNGKWETTGTKKFYSINGPLKLRKDSDSSQSPLIAHLNELKVINYQEEKKNNKKDIAKAEVKTKPKEVKPETKETVVQQSKPKEIAEEKVIVQAAPKENINKEAAPKTIIKEERTTNPVSQKPVLAIAETKPKEITPKQTLPVETSTSVNKPQVIQTNTVAAKPRTNPEPVKTSGTTSAPIEKTIPKEAPKEIKATVSDNKQPQENKPIVTKAVIVTEVKPQQTIASKPETTSVPTVIEKRVTNNIQTVVVSSDSLILSFYDNGVVDGDSISVYINNENIVSKVKLTEAAVKKTVYTNTFNADEIKLTLVAENLGSLPPNTGLLIIQDGTQRYQIRFSADMETNASIIIKKKK